MGSDCGKEPEPSPGLSLGPGPRHPNQDLCHETMEAQAALPALILDGKYKCLHKEKTRREGGGKNLASAAWRCQGSFRVRMRSAAMLSGPQPCPSRQWLPSASLWAHWPLGPQPVQPGLWVPVNMNLTTTPNWRLLPASLEMDLSFPKMTFLKIYKISYSRKYLQNRVRGQVRQCSKVSCDAGPRTRSPASCYSPARHR